MNLPVKQLQEIAAQDMSRQEFLKFAGASILGVIGVWGLVQNLQLIQSKATNKKSAGYGSSPYGG